MRDRENERFSRPQELISARGGKQDVRREPCTNTLNTHVKGTKCTLCNAVKCCSCTVIHNTVKKTSVLPCMRAEMKVGKANLLFGLQCKQATLFPQYGPPLSSYAICVHLLPLQTCINVSGYLVLLRQGSSVREGGSKEMTKREI